MRQAKSSVERFAGKRVCTIVCHSQNFMVTLINLEGFFVILIIRNIHSLQRK